MEEENKKNVLGDLLKNKKVIIGLVVVVIVIILGFVLNSFVSRNIGENIAENILENQLGGNVDLDSDGNSFSINTENGSLNIGESVKWPSDMPNDIPEFKAGKLVLAGTSIADTTGWQVAANNITKNDFDNYHSELKSKGWVDSSTMNVGIEIIQMKKGEMNLVCSFNPEDKSFTLTVTPGE